MPGLKFEFVCVANNFARKCLGIIGDARQRETYDDMRQTGKLQFAD